MAIGGKTAAEWSEIYRDAYRTGGAEAENAARAQYANAYYDTNPTIQRPAAPVTAQDLQTPIFGNVAWENMPQGGGSLAVNDPFSGGSTRPTAAPAPGGGASTGGASTAGQNPYLQQMGNVMVGQMTDNFNRRVMPSIASGAMAAGNFGGSRQGVVEANAMNDLNGQIGGALTNLYGNGFNTALNYDLGLRGNDLGFANLDAQINQNNFNNNLAGANFGLGLWNQGMSNNQTGINAGTNIQNTPMNYWSQFGNQYNSIGQGFGTTTGSASQQGNPLMGALGGAQLGSQIGNWWGGGGGTGMTGSNAPASSYNIGSFDYGIGGGGGGGLGLKF